MPKLMTRRSFALALCLAAATTAMAPLAANAAGAATSLQPFSPMAAHANAAHAQPVSDRMRDRSPVTEVRHGYDRLSFHDVRRSLRHRGYRQINVVGQSRGHYVAYAVGRRGPVKLIVNGRNGEIVKRERLVQRNYGRRGGGDYGNNGLSFTFRFGH